MQLLISEFWKAQARLLEGMLLGYLGTPGILAESGAHASQGEIEPTAPSALFSEGADRHDGNFADGDDAEQSVGGLREYPPQTQSELTVDRAPSCGDESEMSVAESEDAVDDAPRHKKPRTDVSPLRDEDNYDDDDDNNGGDDDGNDDDDDDDNDDGGCGGGGGDDEEDCAALTAPAREAGASDECAADDAAPRGAGALTLYVYGAACLHTRQTTWEIPFHRDVGDSKRTASSRGVCVLRRAGGCGGAPMRRWRWRSRRPAAAPRSRGARRSTADSATTRGLTSTTAPRLASRHPRARDRVWVLDASLLLLLLLLLLLRLVVSRCCFLLLFMFS